MTYQELEIEINNLIAKDEIEKAIALLSTYFTGHEALKDIILQSGRLHSLRKDQRNGVVDYATVQRTLNQLRANILEFVQSVKAANLNRKDLKPAVNVKRSIVEEFRPALGRVAALLVLKKIGTGQRGLTITEIHELSTVKNRKHIHNAVKIMEEMDLVAREKEGRINYWKLSSKGMKLAMEFEAALSNVLE